MEPEAGRTARTGRGWLSRSVICLLAAVAWLTLFLAGARPLARSSTFLALGTGRIALETTALPERDSFTHTAADRTWVPGEWLSGVLLHQVHRAAGVAGLRLFGGLAAVLAVAVVSVALWRTATDLPRAAAGTVLAAYLLLPHVGPVPDLLGALCALLLLLGLTTARRELRLLDAVPAGLLTALGANLSPLTLLALPLLAVHFLGETLARPLRRRRGSPVPSGHALVSRAVCLAAVAGGSLVNPQGPWIWALLFEELRGRFPLLPGRGAFPLLPGSGGIALTTWVAAVLALTLLLLNLAGLLFTRRGDPLPRAALPAALTSIASAAAGIFSLRLLWLLIVPVVQSLGSDSPLSAALEEKGLTRLLDRRAGRALAVLGVVLLLVPLWWDGRAYARLVAVAGVRPYLVPVDRGALPVGAVAFMQDAGLRGRLYHEPAWGGFLAHALPGSPTFLDERTSLFPRHVWDAAEGIAAGGEEAGRLLRDYGVELLLVRRGFRVPRDGGGEWTPVFRNRTAALLVFRGHLGWQNLAKSAAYYQAQGLPQELAGGFVEAAVIEANPAWAREFELLDPVSLASALALYGELHEADRRGAELAALRQLGNLYARLGLDESALREWRRGLRIEPRDRNLLWNVAVAQVRLERYGEARRSLQTYLALHPGDSEAERTLAALDQLHPF